MNSVRQCRHPYRKELLTKNCSPDARFFLCAPVHCTAEYRKQLLTKRKIFSCALLFIVSQDIPSATVRVYSSYVCIIFGSSVFVFGLCAAVNCHFLLEHNKWVSS